MRQGCHGPWIAVLREPPGRGGSVFVHGTLCPGDRLGVGGPRNHFPLVPSKTYLFIAGGTGVTPLLPIVRQVELLCAECQLLYGGVQGLVPGRRTRWWLPDPSRRVACVECQPSGGRNRPVVPGGSTAFTARVLSLSDQATDAGPYGVVIDASAEVSVPPGRGAISMVR